jgi:hypothetical protein
MPSEANMTTFSTGRPSPRAVAVPAATVRMIAVAPTNAGASQRAQRLIKMLLSPLSRKPPRNLYPGANEGNWAQVDALL